MVGLPPSQAVRELIDGIDKAGKDAVAQATHYLALTQITESLGSRAANVHFQDYVKDGQLFYDYRLRPGIVSRSNAIELMRSVGLEI